MKRIVYSMLPIDHSYILFISIDLFKFISI